MACGTVLGNPSRMYPPRAAAAETTGVSSSKTISSGTRSPRCWKAAICRPAGVSARTSARSTSPDEMCCTPNFAASRSPCVPLPPPGAAIISSLTSPPSGILVTPTTGDSFIVTAMKPSVYVPRDQVCPRKLSDREPARPQPGRAAIIGHMTSATPPDGSVHIVVGYDGSAPASRALDAAVRLLQGRAGRIVVIYVAHLSSLVMMSADAIAEMESDF